jgi:hypothetical protein
MTYRLRWVILIALLTLSACKSGDSDATGPSGKASLSSRYEAAKSITNTAQRDQALSGVAGDAAKEGDATVVKKCIQSITASAVRDDAAFNGAIALAKAEKGQEATEVALMITSVARKDEALAKIAKGD